MIGMNSTASPSEIVLIVSSGANAMPVARHKIATAIEMSSHRGTFRRALCSGRRRSKPSIAATAKFAR